MLEGRLQPDGSVMMTAPAKVNLTLHITGRRDDGYHFLESLVVFTAFGDELQLQSGHHDKLELSGPFADTTGDVSTNVCLHALQMFRDAGGTLDPVHIRLQKHIPVGAGLGGGSSDAAAVLRYANAITPTPLPVSTLHDIAQRLGADVPVCLDGKAAVMRGIGEDLTAVTPAPTGHILLARPDVMLSTPEVFLAFKASGRAVSAPSDQMTGMESLMAGRNDLQDAAISLCPEVGNLLDVITSLADGHFRRQGVARMSGSGSACFALFETAQTCQDAAAKLVDQGYWAIATTF